MLPSVRSLLCLTLAFTSLAASCRDEDTKLSPANEPGGEKRHFVLEGGNVVGVGVRDLEIEGGKIVRVGSADSSLARVSAKGRFVSPALIDSHVHLAYLPKKDELVAHGIAGVVDLASPKAFLVEDHSPLRVVAAGPMLTAPGGYPTESWGSDGYGLEVASTDEARAAVDELAKLGARVIKLPLAGPPLLEPATFSAAAERAHDKKLRVVTHALGNAAALAAAKGGADVLGHTPIEALSEETLAAWKGKAVISTLSAFGGPVARNNLKQLRAHGAKILYGTDFGNTSVLGASESELEALSASGMEGTAIVASLTSEPASYWGFSELGSLDVGKAASFLVLEHDPTENPATLAKPLAVYVDGVLVELSGGGRNPPVTSATARPTASSSSSR
jgi:predicted amidohydrolase YtcJ